MPNITTNHAVTHTHIMGDELHLKSLVFDIFIKLIISRELHTLKTLKFKYWLKFRIFRIFRKKIPDKILLDVLICAFRFLKHLLMP